MTKCPTDASVVVIIHGEINRHLYYIRLWWW